MKRALTLGLAAVAVLATGALARAETIAIVGGTVEPVSGPAIPGGTVIIHNGLVAAIGRNVSIPPNAKRIDARGKIVTPGFINVATQLGLVEVGAERATRNASSRGAIAASFRTWEGFNSESAFIASTREDGITSVGLLPAGRFVAGQTAIVDLIDGTGSEMVRRGPTGVYASVQTGGFFGSDVDEMTAGDNTADGPASDPPVSRGEAFGVLRELLDDARTYAAHRSAYDEARLRSLGASRASLVALQPVVNGRLPLLVAADRVDDIDQTLRLAREERIHVVLLGAAEAWRIAPRIAAAHVAVVTGAMNNIPTSFDTLNQRQENAAILRRAGVEVAITGNAGGGDEEAFNARNVRFEAGNAVAYGMSHGDALRAVTLGPALVAGVGDRIGALRPGMDANIVVWSGDPFEFATHPEHVFVRGVEYRDRSRQDRLMDRYRRLPPTTN